MTLKCIVYMIWHNGITPVLGGGGGMRTNPCFWKELVLAVHKFFLEIIPIIPCCLCATEPRGRAY